MNREQAISVLKGAGIAAAGALLTYVTQWVSGADFGSYTPLIVAVWSIVANAGRKFITPTTAAILAIAMLTNSAFAAPPRLAEAGPPSIKLEPRARSIAESSVYISVDLGNGGSAHGTGTAIAAENGRTLILTNAHVVPSAAHPITVTYWSEGKPWTSPATYIDGSSVDDVGPNLIRVNGPDLALLSIAADLPPVEIADAIPVEGEAVSLYGFGGTGSQVYPRHKPGQILAETNWRTTAGDPIVRVSIESTHGDSGSAILNDRGQLVAVLWGGGAVRLDTVYTFTAVKLRGPGLFPRLQAKLAAKKIAKAAAAAPPKPTPPPAVKSPEPAKPAAADPTPSPCPGGVCPPKSRGVLRRR